MAKTNLLSLHLGNSHLQHFFLIKVFPETSCLCHSEVIQPLFFFEVPGVFPWIHPSLFFSIQMLLKILPCLSDTAEKNVAFWGWTGKRNLNLQKFPFRITHDEKPRLPDPWRDSSHTRVFAAQFLPFCLLHTTISRLWQEKALAYRYHLELFKNYHLELSCLSASKANRFWRCIHTTIRDWTFSGSNCLWPRALWRSLCKCVLAFKTAVCFIQDFLPFRLADK